MSTKEKQATLKAAFVFASVMTHVAVSFSKALITLGLADSAETIHKVDIVSYSKMI